MPSVHTEGGLVVVAEDPDAQPIDLLSRALERARFWDDLSRAEQIAGRARSAFRIVILPEIAAFASGSPAATEAALVEGLLDLLFAGGYENVTVAAGRDSSALWSENRDVSAIADLLGYRFATPGGHAYDITDLTVERPTLTPSCTTWLSPGEIAGAWADADYRIVFAKNKTDDRAGYSLCLDALVGVLVLEDKDYYYRHRCDLPAVISEIVRDAPPHFCIIDAVISAHGNGGSRAPRPLRTGTIIASSSPALADYVGALKMGLDPAVSPVVRRVFEDVGLPTRYEVDGSLARYRGWRNPHPLVLDSTKRRERWVSLNRSLKPWLQERDVALFPAKQLVDAKASDILLPLVSNPDDDQAAFWTLVLGNYLLDGLAQAVHAFQVLYDKDSVRRRHVALNVAPDDYSPEDYRAIVDEMHAVALALQPLRSRQGLRWTYCDEAIIFESSTLVPIDFDTFVGAVDVTKTIQYMNDYLGGVAVTRARDDAGRVTHQLERNVYLPQPNYIVFYQGDVIDVTKLEYADYSADAHRMFWKTIKSENGSARFDDGIVTFARSQEGTTITICGRQLFALPPLLQMAQLDLNPEWKAYLVTHAYQTFFGRTFSNLEAVAEGRDIRVGRPWHDPSAGPGTEPLASEQVAAIAMKLAERFASLARPLVRGAQPATAPVHVDSNGFAHFTPSARASESSSSGSPVGPAAGWATLWSDLAGAFFRDLQAVSRAGPV